MKQNLHATVADLHQNIGTQIQISHNEWLWIQSGKESFVVSLANSSEKHHLDRPLQSIVISRKTHEVTYCIYQDTMTCVIVEDPKKYEAVLHSVIQQIWAAHTLHLDSPALSEC